MVARHIAAEYFNAAWRQRIETPATTLITTYMRHVSNFPQDLYFVTDRNTIYIHFFFSSPTSPCSANSVCFDKTRDDVSTSFGAKSSSPRSDQPLSRLCPLSAFFRKEPPLWSRNMASNHRLSRRREKLETWRYISVTLWRTPLFR